MAYYFFLSYARGDDNVFIQQFFRDLSSEVRAHAGLRNDQEVGFLDLHSIGVGEAWSARLMSALSDSRCFIALCSPRYFLSEPCGKEWTVFAARLAAYQQANSVRPPALLPLIWLPPRYLPPVVEELQYTSDALPDEYGSKGLRQLLRLQRLRDSYLEFVSELASQIVETAHAHPLPPLEALPPFAEVPNAFPPSAEAINNSVPVGPPPAALSPQSHYVHFVVAAPSRDQLAAPPLSSPRRDHAYYGEQPVDWSPYQPTMPTPIAKYAAAIAERRSFAPVVADISMLGHRIDEARARNQIVVLLLDVWSTHLHGHRDALSECGSRDQLGEEPTTAVLVPSNPDDVETQAQWPGFADEVRGFFPHRAPHGDTLFRPSVLSHLAFDADLQVVLEVARNRTFVTGQVFRTPPPGPARELPILQGP
ncbi:MAG TPA: TIR-like protein FxsC [Rugosimonospora sp.]|nr:TIR-like protein FxsC [Rugosimonospora sp.]